MTKSRHEYLNKDKDKPLLVAVCDFLRENANKNNFLSQKGKKLGEFITLPMFCLAETTFQEKITLLENCNLSVVMDVFEVNETLLDELDEYYGYFYNGCDENLNKRTKIETPYGDAYIYVNVRKLNSIKAISCGDLVDYLQYNTQLELPLITIER